MGSSARKAREEAVVIEHHHRGHDQRKPNAGARLCLGATQADAAEAGERASEQQFP